MGITAYDNWIADGSDKAALVVVTPLEPVEGKGAAVFPPTYPKPPDWDVEKQGEWIGYDVSDDGTCLMDTVGSQGNRLEPIFMRPPFDKLVPQVEIEVEPLRKNLLEAGHRLADASIRFANMAERKGVFLAVREGNYVPLAKVNPTALVHGVWDSRETGVKIPRVLDSTVRAYGVQARTRSAIYQPLVDYVAKKIVDKKEISSSDKIATDKMSAVGLSHAPSVRTHGGITADRIERAIIISFARIRQLAAPTAEETMRLRRYILGLTLVQASARVDELFQLRQGCLLKEAGAPSWKVKSYAFDSEDEDAVTSPGDALRYAEIAAERFGVGESMDLQFDPKAAIQKAKSS